MKLKKIAAAIFVLAIIMILSGCTSAVDLSDHALVGTWNWDDNQLWQYHFNADGTGARGFSDSMESFTWSTQGNGQIRINSFIILRENWSYSMDGDALTLSSNQVAGVTYIYIRDGAPPRISYALIGEWLFDDNILFELVLDADGTGRIGLPDSSSPLQWAVLDEGHLRIDVIGGYREHHSYVIDGDMLILTNREVAGLVTNYVRRGAPPRISYALVGEWLFEDNILFELVLDADGTGRIGLPDNSSPLRWVVPSDGHLRMDIAGGDRYHDNYVVDGDLLILTSREFAGVATHYVRRGAPPRLNPELFGVWLWDEDADFERVFFYDGTGQQGFSDRIETFRWSTLGDGHLRLDIDGGSRENWNYIIDGDVLTLDSRQVAGIIYSYIRN